jgi:hypothetical protein
MSKSKTRKCDYCKKVCVWRRGDFCADCRKLTGKVNPIKQKQKRTAAQQLLQNAVRRKRRLAKREAGFLAARMVLPPTQEEKDQASATALEFFLKKKEEAIKSNPGKEIIISIAVVSKGGRRNIVQEMRKASLEGGGKKCARLVKIVLKEGKNYWRNPTAQETSDISEEGFMIYDGEYNHFLAEHVEAFLHNHIKANLKNESIRLLQTISGNDETKSSEPLRLECVYSFVMPTAILLLGLFERRSSLRTLPFWNRSISKNAVTRNW